MMWCGMGGWNVFLFLYLSRLAANGLGAEGAGRLEEPLGRRPTDAASTWRSLGGAGIGRSRECIHSLT